MILDQQTSQRGEKQASGYTKQAGRRLLLGALTGGLLAACGEPHSTINMVRDEPYRDPADIITYPRRTHSPEATVVRLIQHSLQPSFRGVFAVHPSGRITRQQAESVMRNSFREEGFEVTSSEVEKKRYVYLQNNPTYNGPLDNRNWPGGSIRSARYSLTLDQDGIWSGFNLSGLSQLDRIPAIQKKVHKKFGPNGRVVFDLLPEVLCDAAFSIGVLPSQTEQLIVPASSEGTDHCDITGIIGSPEKPIQIKFSIYQSGSWRLQLTGTNYIPRP